MSTKYDVEINSKIWAILVGQALIGSTITHGDLSQALGLTHHRPLRHNLDAVYEACEEFEYPQLTRLVVRQDEVLESGWKGLGDPETEIQRVYEFEWHKQPNPFIGIEGL